MKVLWLVVSVVILSVAIFLGYFGAFTPIKVELKEQEEIYFVKKSIVGDYAQSGTVQAELYKSLLADSIETTNGIGIYYDNPQEVPVHELRSDVGCIISVEDTSKIHMLFKYEVAKLNRGSYITADFPFKGQMSIMFGILRVYPKLDTYSKENKLDIDYAVEIYDVPGKKTTYMMRLNPQALQTN